MGKLGWTEYEYYTSSPYMFFAACEGYFDKEKSQEVLMRRVALFASQRGSDEFNKYWPLDGKGIDVKKVWGTKEEANEFRKKIEEAHGIKLL